MCFIIFIKLPKLKLKSHNRFKMRATDIALSILFVLVLKEATALSYNFLSIECRDVDQMTIATEVCSFDGPRANIATLIKKTLTKVVVS